MLTFKLARVYYHLRDWTRLEETLNHFLAQAPNHPFAGQAREHRDRVTGREHGTHEGIRIHQRVGDVDDDARHLCLVA